MDVDILVPLLLPLAAWPVARIVAPRLPPQPASWLLTAATFLLATGSTAALLVEALAGLSLVPMVADAGHWSPTALRGLDSVSVPIAITSGLILVTMAVTLARVALRYRRWTRQVHRELDAHSLEGGVIVLPGDEALAFSVPGRGGRIAISAGMLAELEPKERCALLAHERAHLRCRHSLFLAAVMLSTLANPLLQPLGTAARFALERWADESAARRVGDRTLVATAVAKAALAGQPMTPGTFALTATGGPVPRRVSALLAAPSPRHRISAALLGALVLGVAGWSTEAAIDAASDLHAGIEVAQGATPHAMIGQRPHCEATLPAFGQHHRKCAQR